MTKIIALTVLSICLAGVLGVLAIYLMFCGGHAHGFC